MVDPTTEWIASNYPRLSKKFAGKYIAIVNQKIVASGTTSTVVIKKAHKVIPDNEPILMKVPPKGILI
ncbi:MAG: DUF5678 domain-containing protein [Nitrososphaeraceae archaeon]